MSVQAPILAAVVFLPVAAALAGIALARAASRRAGSLARALRVLADKLDFQANHDPLTGLPNRARFEAALGAAIDAIHAPTGTPPDPALHSVLLYLDLDQFRVINDICGCAAGDEFIKQVAWRVQRLIHSGDTLARLGGDEFGLLLADCSLEDALARAETIRGQIHDLRLYWQNKAHSLCASIGVLPLDANVRSGSEALSAAAQACHLAKDSGRNRVQLYRRDDPQMQLRRGELQWVEQIHAALDSDGFVLMAQEIQPLGREAAAAAPRRFELLLRMKDGSGQLISPMAFIPVAERYGLMPRIDRWVIARVCNELAVLRDAGAELPTCLVNLSGTSVGDPGLGDYITTCLAAHSLHGSHVGFELTETAAISNLRNCAQLLSRLRALGCLILLDDFGSGMSSFAYLRALPVDLLKIDGSFIRDITSDPVDHAMVETMHRIGSIMGVRTVAECVENAELLAQLMLIGVDFAQGYHLHRPMPLAQLRELPAPVVPVIPSHDGPDPAELHRRASRAR